MACGRRSLTSNFTHLTRRLHPSFAHILRDDDRESTQPRYPLPLPPILSRRHASPFPASISGFGGRRTLGRFSFPLGLDPCLLRSYSSTSEGSDEVGYIKDAVDVLSDSSVETAAAAAAAPAPFPGEVAAAAADSFLPVAALQHLIDAVHSFTGLNWWAAIALTTVLIKGATVPLLLNQMKATAKLSEMSPELEQIKAQVNTRDPQLVYEGQRRMKALFQKHGVSPLTPLKGMLIQGPIFISFFFAISNMVEKVPSFKGGGAFWFTDLTTPDPQCMLPLLTALTFLATVELNMQEGMEGNPRANNMKNFSRILALMTVPFTASFPKAIFFYWITSNLFSLMYGLVLKRPPVRKFLNLPDIVPQPAIATQTNFSFFDASKPMAPAASPPTAMVSEQTKTSERNVASSSVNPTEPAASPPTAKVSEQTKTSSVISQQTGSERRVSSSSVISHRVRNLEKTMKARNKQKKR